MFIDIFNTDEKYSIIYADPPWSYKAWDKGGNGCALNHYSTMTKQDIYNLPVAELAADDCTLFLWVTFPCLEQGIETIKRWGFQYKTIGFNWVKRNKRGKGWFWGLGFWTRSNSEICLIGVKGNPKRASASVHSVIDAPIEGHSKKPEIVRKKIMELMGGGTAIELFARQGAAGWDCWGNEVAQDDINDDKGGINLLEAPKLGGIYYIIIDIWETLCAVPVTLMTEDDGVFVGRWQISEEYADDYDGLEARDLYATEADAWAAINEGGTDNAE